MVQLVSKSRISKFTCMFLYFGTIHMTFSSSSTHTTLQAHTSRGLYLYTWTGIKPWHCLCVSARGHFLPPEGTNEHQPDSHYKNNFETLHFFLFCQDMNQSDLVGQCFGFDTSWSCLRGCYVTLALRSTGRYSLQPFELCDLPPAPPEYATLLRSAAIYWSFFMSF